MAAAIQKVYILFLKKLIYWYTLCKKLELYHKLLLWD